MIKIVEEFSSDELESLVQKFVDKCEVYHHRDADRIYKRIARVGEFDNGRVMHGDWQRISALEAEELARAKSIQYPDKTFYVQYDDIMIGSSDIKWKNGQFIK